MKRHYIPVTADVPGVSEGTRSFIRRIIRTALTEQGVDFPCEVDVLVTTASTPSTGRCGRWTGPRTC